MPQPFLIALCLALFVTSPQVNAAEIVATKVGDSVVDAKALTINGGFGQSINGKSFQQDAVISHKDYQYIAYYDGNRHVCLARRKLPAGDWAIIRFLDYDFKSNDAHNTISMGICPADGTIHLAFDHHVHPLHYRVSKINVATSPETVEWQSDLFGPIKSKLMKDKPVTVTYPRFWQTPEGDLQFSYRRGGSGIGDRIMMDYQPADGTWGNVRQMDSRKGKFRDWNGKNFSNRCSYPNGYNYGPDGKLHVTWVWRERSGRGGSNHDLLYAYSEDQGNTWRNNAGDLLEGPIHLETPGIAVAKIHRGYGLLNTQGQAVDSQGRIHFIAKYCSEASLKAAGSKMGEQRWGPPAARRYHHYWRNDSGKWRNVELPVVAGNRPKLFIDDQDNAYLIFSDAADVRPAPPSGIISPRQGTLKIMAATSASKWTDWQLVHTEKGPFVNEMLGDFYRWQKENVLSIMVQELPEKAHDSTPLRVIDFTFN